MMNTRFPPASPRFHWPTDQPTFPHALGAHAISHFQFSRIGSLYFSSLISSRGLRGYCKPTDYSCKLLNSPGAHALVSPQIHAIGPDAPAGPAYLNSSAVSTGFPLGPAVAPDAGPTPSPSPRLRLSDFGPRPPQGHFGLTRRCGPRTGGPAHALASTRAPGPALNDASSVPRTSSPRIS